MELAGLFDILIGTELDSHASHRAYGSVTIWNVRRDMLQATSDAYFLSFNNQTLKKNLDDAIKHVDRYAPRRNDIAHGIVITYDQFLKIKHPLGGFSGWLLFPAYTSTKSMALPLSSPKYGFNAKTITEFGDKFRAIRPSISRLIEEIRKRETFPLEGH